MKMRNVILPVFLLLGMLPEASKAQGWDLGAFPKYTDDWSEHLFSKRKQETSYRVETFGTMASGDNTPFWTQQHSWGVVPLESGSYYLKAGIVHRRQLSNKLFLELGADIVTTSKQPHQKNFWLQQAFGKLRWKSLQLSAGMSEDYYSTSVDPYLSLGDLTFSNNARPIPQIKIGIPYFTPIPLTKKTLYIKGEVSVGKFLDDSYLEEIATATNQNYTTGTLSHHKSLSIRIGNIDDKEKGVQFTFGADHASQWGGKIHLEGGQTLSMSEDAKSFLNTFAFKSNEKKVQLSSGIEKTLKENSHFASLSMKIDYGVGFGDEIYSVYYQHPAENRAGIKFNNLPDMLFGVQYKAQYKKLVSNLIFEFFYSKNQNVTLTDEGTVAGNDKGFNNYYNSSSYLQGRSHFGMSIGSSIFLSPRYNEDGYLGFKSNRIFALHGAMEGYLTNQIKYSLLGTFGESLGTFIEPFLYRKRGLAGEANLTYSFPKIPGLSITGSGAFNSGYFFETKSYGGSLSIRKTGKIF